MEEAVVHMRLLSCGVDGAHPWPPPPAQQVSDFCFDVLLDSFRPRAELGESVVPLLYGEDLAPIPAEFQGPLPLVPFLHSMILDFGEAWSLLGVRRQHPVRFKVKPADYLNLEALKSNPRSQATLRDAFKDMGDLLDQIEKGVRGAPAKLERLRVEHSQNRKVRNALHAIDAAPYNADMPCSYYRLQLARCPSPTCSAAFL